MEQHDLGAEPTTEAGRALLYIHGEAMREPVLAIEAEARIDAFEVAEDRVMARYKPGDTLADICAYIWGEQP